MLKTRALKIFDCLKSLIIKIHVQSEIFDLQRVLKKINHMHRDLTKIISSLSIFKSDSASQKKEQTEMMRVFAKNLNVMIKHCNKNVMKRLKNKTFIQIVAKTNTTINRMKNELRVFANFSDNSSKNRVLIFQNLRSEDIKFFVRKKKNVMFLCQHSQWIRLYDVEIRMQLRIFEILMHSIKINTFVLHDDRNMTIVIETLIDAKTTRIFELTMKEIIFMKWLKKIVLDENEQISVMLKFIFVETIDAVIQRHFVWDEEIHICERFFRNCKIKQYYNCWRYDHIENQCFSISKCDRCEESKHLKSVCQMFIIRAKCAICEESHETRNRHCCTRQQKMKKTKSNENWRHFILFCQANVYQIRCHTLFIIFRNSFFTQQCRKRRTSRASERHSERFSEQNLVSWINIIRINIWINLIRISVKINIIKFSSVLLSCHFRHRFHYRLRRSLRCHFRRRNRAAFYNFIDDLVNISELTNNNDVNERTKSLNNHSHQRHYAVNFIYRETQTQIDRHVLF